MKKFVVYAKTGKLTIPVKNGDFYQLLNTLIESKNVNRIELINEKGVESGTLFERKN